MGRMSAEKGRLAGKSLSELGQQIGQGRGGVDVRGSVSNSGGVLSYVCLRGKADDNTSARKRVPHLT